MQRLQYASCFFLQRLHYAEAGSNRHHPAWGVLNLHDMNYKSGGKQRGRQAPQHGMSWDSLPAESTLSGCQNVPGALLWLCNDADIYCATPRPDCGPHVPCTPACLYGVLVSQRQFTHRTLVICASAWVVRPARSTVDPQAILVSGRPPGLLGITASCPCWGCMGEWPAK